jgi:NAD(P)-dependent dehydrogenase (short-subunit alcohol dehydrogenase family)
MMAKQLAPLGIRVNTASGSGMSYTGRMDRPVMLDTKRADDRAVMGALSTMPWPSPAWADTDASAAVAFLASDESLAVTGQHVTADAGVSLN